jgi:hypothetical protein
MVVSTKALQSGKSFSVIAPLVKPSQSVVFSIMSVSRPAPPLQIQLRLIVFYRRTTLAMAWFEFANRISTRDNFLSLTPGR